jgi:hypothetical protein
MTLLIILAVYLLGCILAYWRLMGSIYEIEETHLLVRNLYPNYFPQFNGISWLSWISFIIGIIIYIRDKEKYFFKFSRKPLIRQYENYNKRVSS